MRVNSRWRGRNLTVRNGVEGAEREREFDHTNSWTSSLSHLLQDKDFTLPYGFSPQWPVEWPMWCPLDKENPGSYDAPVVKAHQFLILENQETPSISWLMND